MAWENLIFSDGQIMFANSHMNPLQANFNALANQESGAPKIDVSCMAGNLIEAQQIITSDFQADVGCFGTLHVGSAAIDNIVIPNLSAESIIASDLQIDVASINTLTVSEATINYIGVNSIDVNSSINLAGKPMFACRAWVNFDSTGTSGASRNVLSVTKIANGNYVVTFNISMTNTNYVAVGMGSLSAGLGGTGAAVSLFDPASKSTTSCAFGFLNTIGTTLFDTLDGSIAFFE